MLNARTAWRDLSIFERDRVTLEALGDDHLTVADLTARLGEKNAAHAAGVYDGHVRSILERLRHAGDVQRARLAPCAEGEHHATRWRYSRNVALTGPIADLERAFQNDSDGACGQ
ncbi:MAG: hypothetical protein ACRDMZ_14635 [Solirubrobacteraceae bacterium]